MKYLLLVYFEEQAVGQDEWADLMSECAQLIRDLKLKDQYLGADPLHPTSTATSVKVRNQKRLVTDGPFAETREQLGGYFLIKAEDLDQALSVAARVPMARKGVIEVRPVYEVVAREPD
jgi:hypothetical protein